MERTAFKLHRSSVIAAALNCVVALTPALALPSTSAITDTINEQLGLVKKLENSPNKAAYADALFNLGVRYNNLGNIEESKQAFEKALAIEQTLKRPSKELEARIAIARAYLLSKDTTAAIKKYEEAIEFAKSNGLKASTSELGLALVQRGKMQDAEKIFRDGIASGGTDPIDKSTMMRNLAVLLAVTSRYDEAIALQKQSIDILSKDGDDADYGKSIVELAELQNQAGQPLVAQQTLDDARKKFNAELLPEVFARTEFSLGSNYYERERINDARTHYSEAVNLARSIDNEPDILIQSLIGLGTAECDLENFTQAEAHHKEAVDLAASLGRVDLLVKAEMQLAHDYLIQGRVERALQLLKKSLLSSESASLDDRGNVLATMARCYASLGQRQAAEKYYRDAIALFNDAQNNASKAMTLNSLAVLFLDDGDIASFDSVIADSREFYVLLSPRDQAKVEYNEAQALLMKRQYAGATASFKKALDKAVAAGDEGLQSNILRGLGTASYLSEQPKEALEYFRKALALTENSGSIESQWDNNLGIGKCYKALGQAQQAEPYLRKAIALVENERSNLTRDSFKTHNLDLRKDCFQELVDLLVATNRPYEALEIAERGKARAFLDMLANKKERAIASTDVTAPAVPARAPERQLVAMADSGMRSVKVMSKGGEDSDTFEETAVSPVNAAPPTVDEIKSLVANRKSTCVEFLMAGGKIYTWVVRPDGSINTAIPVTVPANFQAHVRELLTGMTKTAKTPGEIALLGAARQKQLRALYDMLIKPIDQYLPKEKDEVITIVPHDVLFCIPFSALMADNGDYLIERHTLSYAPAIGVLRATQKLREQADQMPHKLLAFGNPITKRIEFLGTLPYAEKEVKHIASLYPPTQSTIEIGDAATKSKFTELAPNASEIHLATHGLVDEEHPMKSAVVLAPTDTDDGILSVRDILTLKNLKARIVVLSACQTGRGKITGDGVVGLSRAFIIAGAPSVLVSQWNVDDIMTDYQMEKFYRFYLNGSGRARALRDAQLATIKYMETGPDGQQIAHSPGQIRANPRYWAAFQLIGEI